ncbi:polyadenylate-binding protein-interacting protein 8-like [Heracleum sosnowskyi]|uniref:Polyadenylate-binding protein-interacting protein 8-like n=1 Tax=Heracleum sosnowskyi TaxID=360622 RepID=A0AAD8GTQ0_9APIA|nr:polyadenylate-binding protein-interacting protein 8-like [Heracleum sosnowskyi]
MTGEGVVKKSEGDVNSPSIGESGENCVNVSNGGKKLDSNAKSEYGMQDLVDMLSKLNPMAKEFFPSSYSNDRVRDQFGVAFFVPVQKIVGNDGQLNNRRRRNNFNQGRKRMSGRAFRAQREDSIRRTVYVSEIDHNVTEERLAALFCGYGQVVDCRICGDPHSRLRFAFVEFGDEYSARAALSLDGTLLGFSPIKVLPSKTAILPVNPTFLPKSEDEREMCARTVYCTNIDKKVSQADVKIFFETRCGEVSRLRLLGDQVHSTRIAFVEFVMAESAILALNCCGQVLGSQPVRVSPSKTPVRPRAPHPGGSCRMPEVRVVMINTQYIETDSLSFKSVVQRLTGKDAIVEAEEPPAMQIAGGCEVAQSNSVLLEAELLKDFDLFLTGFPLSFDCNFQLITD